LEIYRPDLGPILNCAYIFKTARNNDRDVDKQDDVEVVAYCVITSDNNLLIYGPSSEYEVNENDFEIKVNGIISNP
jgi:hypothetical protein